MQIQITQEELSKRKLFLAVPMYGGVCAGLFTKSIMDLMVQATRLNVEVRPYFIFNESLITRARNYCADVFMRSDCTHFMFIDSDIQFDSNDVLALLALQSDDSEYDVITGTYPKKTISFEKVKLAVDKGFADENPNDLENFTGDFVFNPIIEKGQAVEIPLHKPVEVAEAGTGFMMIKRKTFEKYAEAYPEYRFIPDHVRTKDFDGSREIQGYFECIIHPESKRYLSEDYAFCYNVRKLGMKVWLCPWMQLRHIGSYVFGGSLQALAAVGASPTAGEEVKKYNK